MAELDDNHEKVEATPELKRLLGRLANGNTLDIVENGIVLGRLQRAEVAARQDEPTIARAQHTAIDEFVAELGKLPREPEPDDGLSGSLDHDRILYGEKE